MRARILQVVINACVGCHYRVRYRDYSVAYDHCNHYSNKVYSLIKYLLILKNMADTAARIAEYQRQFGYWANMSLQNNAYQCPSCWDWPTVYTCAGRSCVVDPTGLGGFTKPDCNNKCRIAKSSHHPPDDKPQWVKRADDMLQAVPAGKCPAGNTGWNIKCYGQMGSDSAFGAVYQVKLPTSAGVYAAQSIVGKCMPDFDAGGDDDNDAEIALAQFASDLVVGNKTPRFPLLVGFARTCVVTLRGSHRLTRQIRAHRGLAQALHIPLPNVASTMYSEMASGDLIMWCGTTHTPEEWKRVVYQVIKGIQDMQAYMNIIHNDMHFGNVLLTAGNTALIHDFGLARVIAAPNRSGSSSASWTGDERMVDLSRFLQVALLTGVTAYVDKGAKKPPAAIISLIQDSQVRIAKAFDYTFTPYTGAARNAQAIKVINTILGKWTPTTAMYRQVRLRLADDECAVARLTHQGVCMTDTGVAMPQCCQSLVDTACVARSSGMCIPLAPIGLLQNISLAGMAYTMGVSVRAGVVLVSLHESDNVPTQFAMVTLQNSTDPLFPDDRPSVLQIFQNSIDGTLIPPQFRADVSSPLYVRIPSFYNKNYPGESQGYVYTTADVSEATLFHFEALSEAEDAGFSIFTMAPIQPTPQKMYLVGDNGGFNLTAQPTYYAATHSKAFQFVMLPMPS